MPWKARKVSRGYGLYLGRIADAQTQRGRTSKKRPTWNVGQSSEILNHAPGLLGIVLPGKDSTKRTRTDCRIRTCLITVYRTRSASVCTSQNPRT